jgi:hypothetical protein
MGAHFDTSSPKPLLQTMEVETDQSDSSLEMIRRNEILAIEFAQNAVSSVEIEE